MARTLIRNATIISVDPNVGDLHRGDILIDGSKIVEIAPSIAADDAEIIDGTNKIAIPGFVDTHRHTWESLLRATGADWTIAAWRTIVAPDGLPEDVKARLAEAVEAAYNSEAYQSFAAERGFGLVWAGPDEATELVAAADASLGAVMKEAGLAKE